MQCVRKMGDQGLPRTVWALIENVTLRSDMCVANVRVAAIELLFCMISHNIQGTLSNSCTMGQLK